MIHTATTTAKFKHFVRRLRAVVGTLPIGVETLAVGLLERLWHATSTSAPRGDIGRLDNELIAEMIGWNGDAETIVAMLVDCGWVDVCPVNRLVIHDWEDHAPNFVKGNAKRLGGFIASAGPPPRDYPQGPTPKGPPQEILSDDYGTLDETPPKGYPLGAPPKGLSPEGGPQAPPAPNLTKPNLTKPNPLPGGGMGTPAEVVQVTATHATAETLPDLPAGGGEISPGSPEAHALARSWAKSRAGKKVPKGENHPDLVLFFQEKIRCGKSPEAIRQAIADPARDRTEFLWQFSRRCLEQQPPGKGQPYKPIEQIVAEMIGDPGKKDTLEVAYYGPN